MALLDVLKKKTLAAFKEQFEKEFRSMSLQELKETNPISETERLYNEAHGSQWHLIGIYKNDVTSLMVHARNEELSKKIRNTR